MHRLALYHGLKKLEEPLFLAPGEVEEALALVSCARRTLPENEPDYPAKICALNGLIEQLTLLEDDITSPTVRQQIQDLCRLFFLKNTVMCGTSLQ